MNSAGDVNHDGYDDLIVGAPHYDNGQEVGGTVFLFLGSATGLNQTGQSDWTAVGGVVDAAVGTSVSSAGDVNNDGFDDIIVGAPHYLDEQGNEGAVFVF
ncbi:MAG: integrin alpha, partial [Anaerolineae bacterium]